jgi:hypothetical protein
MPPPPAHPARADPPGHVVPGVPLDDRPLEVAYVLPEPREGELRPQPVEHDGLADLLPVRPHGGQPPTDLGPSRRGGRPDVLPSPGVLGLTSLEEVLDCGVPLWAVPLHGWVGHEDRRPGKVGEGGVKRSTPSELRCPHPRGVQVEPVLAWVHSAHPFLLWSLISPRAMVCTQCPRWKNPGQLQALRLQ